MSRTRLGKRRERRKSKKKGRLVLNRLKKVERAVTIVTRGGKKPPREIKNKKWKPSRTKKISNEENKIKWSCIIDFIYYYAGQHPTFGTSPTAVHLIRASLSGIREFNQSRVIDMFSSSSVGIFRMLRFPVMQHFGTVNRRIWSSTVEIL